MTLTLRLFTVWLAGLISTFGATSYDVVVYGATSAGIAAAVQVKRMGKSVLVVGPDRHLGGLTAGGLGWTDSGDKRAIGGLAREFYQRVWRHYQNPEAWRWQPAAEYRGNARTKTAFDDATQSAWNFEPHVAERVFEDLVREHQIPVRRDEWLDRERGVTRNAAGASRPSACSRVPPTPAGCSSTPPTKVT
jgi:glycine/D-amino acid oxidase-like deaminating enzyme